MEPSRAGGPRRTSTIALAIAVLAALVAWAPSPATAAGGDTGTLEGTVTSAAGSEPLSGAWVALLRARDLTVAATAVADDAGRFSLDAAPGWYFPYLLDPSGEHRNGFAGGAEPVRLAGGATSNVAATMGAADGAIAGAVVDDVTGEPVSGAWVFSLTASGAPEAGVQTDGAGRYSLDELAPGRHLVVFLDPSAAHAPEFFPDATGAVGATALDVEAGGVTTADASLAPEKAPDALDALSGTVTDARGDPLPGVMVVALDSTSYRFAGAGTTGPTGEYQFDVEAGSYRVAFLDPTGRHEVAWYPDLPYHAMASASPVDAPGVADASLTRTTGVLRGSVVDEVTEDPIEDAWVAAIDVTGAIHGTVTDEHGAYELDDLPAGTYREAVIDTTGGHGLRYWEDSPDFAAARPIEVTAAAPSIVDSRLGEPDAPTLIESAVGWWDVSSGLDASGTLPDLTGSGSNLTLHTGTFEGGPALVAPDPARGRNLFSPGWDDMYLETPDPQTPIQGIDVAWEGDLDRALVLGPVTANWLIHQGSTKKRTFSWAVGIDVETDRIVVAHSADGLHVTTTLSEATAPPGNARTAVTLDPDTGDLHVYRQPFDAPFEDFDAGYDQWELLDTVPGSGPIELFDSPAPIRHSSTVDADKVGQADLFGWFRALYRLRIRDAVGGAEVASLDVGRIPETPVWTDVDGLPPVGGITQGQMTEFPGAAGEVWRITNHATISYPMLIVDRPSLVFGNGSYAEAPVNDLRFDLADDADLSVWCVYGFARLGYHRLPLLAHKGFGWQAAGYAITESDDEFPAGPAILLGDAAGQIRAFPPATPTGGLNITGLQVDRSPGSDTMTAVTNGVAGEPVPLASLGSSSLTGAPLRVASWSDGGGATAGFQFLGMAVFDRLLTQEEIDQLPAAFGLRSTGAE